MKRKCKGEARQEREKMGEKLGGVEQEERLR